VFVADDLAAWLIFILAEAGRKKLTTVILRDDQTRALRPATTEAVRVTAAELSPGDAKRAEELAIMVDPLFKTPVPGAPLGEQATVLEALQVAIAEQLKVLDSPGLTATLTSLTGRDVSATVVAQKLTGHLVRAIMVRGSRGGPLAPLASQLNHDLTHLQGQRLEEMVGEVLQVLARLDQVRTATVPDPPRWTETRADKVPKEMTGGVFFSTVIQGRDITVQLPSLTPEAIGRKQVPGHVFMSYVREDSHHVDQLQEALQAAGIPVWRDTVDLWPGEDWRAKIRHAITDNALVFIACFSNASLARSKSNQNRELALAIEQMQLRRPDEPWLIPVRFDDCMIPDWEIGAGRTLGSIQPADLFGDRADEGAARLVAAILRILEQPHQSRPSP
jgi:TIR domain-containing protein